MSWLYGVVKIICILNICNYVAASKLIVNNDFISDNVSTATGTDVGTNECKCSENSATLRRLELLEDLFKQNRVMLCGAGMQDYRIGDTQISSSDYWDSATNAHHSHVHGRLFNTHSEAQAFCGLLGDVDKWIQVDFNRDVKITGIVTQGRPNADQWVTLFNVQYKPDGAEDFQYVQNDNNHNTFPGNYDRNTLSITSFSTPVVGRYFRLNILEWHGHTCMRLDYLVC